MLEKESNSSSNRRIWLPYVIASLTVSLAITFHGQLPITFNGKSRDIDSKPFTTLTSFYQYYLEEHRDPICRVLHVIGTTLVILSAITRYQYIIVHLSIGISIGLFLCEYLSPLPNGIIEFLSIFVITKLSCLILDNAKFPWQLLIMGYLPAWIGHTFFEHNRPATFIYPTYSLLSDFRMWYEMLKGDLPWNERI